MRHNVEAGGNALPEKSKRRKVLRTRPLTPDEYQHLLKAFGSPKVKRPIRNFFRLSAIISIPLFLFFVTASALGDKRTISESVYRGLWVFFVVPAFLLFQRLAQGRRYTSNPFASAHEDMRAGICRIREFRIARVWPLVDEGNEDDPDYLFETTAGKYIAIPSHDAADQLPFRRTLEIHELPKSRTTVSVAFSGDELSIQQTVIRTDCVWRHDDLPWERPISAKRLPEEAQKVILPSVSNDNSRSAESVMNDLESEEDGKC